MRSFVTIAVIVVVFVVIYALATLLTQVLWSWIIPDVFSSAVEQDILPATLKFWQAFKLNLMLLVWFGGSRASISSKK